MLRLADNLSCIRENSLRSEKSYQDVLYSIELGKKMLNRAIKAFDN